MKKKYIYFLFFILLLISCQNGHQTKESIPKNTSSNKVSALALLMRPNSLKLKNKDLKNLDLVKGFRSLQLGTEFDKLFFDKEWSVLTDSKLPIVKCNIYLENNSFVIGEESIELIKLTFYKNKLVQIKLEPRWPLHKYFIDSYFKLYGIPNIINKVQFHEEPKGKYFLYGLSDFYYPTKFECLKALKKITPRSINLKWVSNNYSFDIVQIDKYSVINSSEALEKKQRNKEFIYKNSFWQMQIVKTNEVCFTLIKEFKEMNNDTKIISNDNKEKANQERIILEKKNLNGL